MLPAGKRMPLALKAAQHKLPVSWRDRWLIWRDRVLANRRFQRWAAGFPITRKIAKKRARTLFDLCAGFVYSQVLKACIELRLFEILAERPQTVTELSRRLALNPKAAARLLNAAAALRLAERRGHGRFGLGELGAALLGNPAISAMVEHHALLYDDLRDPVALLRNRDQTTALSRYWPYALADKPGRLKTDDVARYSTLMSASQALIAEDVLEVWPLTRHRCLLDVGGGEGAFLTAAAARAPNLRLMLFDLPAVADIARERLDKVGLAGRTTVAGGDFFTEPLPQGADIVTLVRVLHDHDDANVVVLLRNIRAALPDEGVLLIAEPMPGVDDNDAIGDAYFGFYLLAMGSGRARSPDELASLLRETGFDGGRLLVTRRPMFTSAIIARPVHDPKIGVKPY
jgi:demethylspheroidene O-methyltransferase